MKKNISILLALALAALTVVLMGYSVLSAKAPEGWQARTVTQAEKTAITVYVTETGKKYHLDGCRYLESSRIPIGLDEARQSYEPCSICRPPR